MTSSIGDRDEAIFAVLQGVPVDAVASELGVSENTIYRWMREGGHTKQLRSLRDKAVINDYLEGDLGVYDLCNEHDICINTLYRILHEHDVQLRKQPTTEEDDKQVVRLYRSGEPVLSIRRITGRSYTTIYSILEEYNVRLRRYSTRRGE